MLCEIGTRAIQILLTPRTVLLIMHGLVQQRLNVV